MKLTDGLFHEVFDAIGAEYPTSSRRSIGSWTSELRNPPTLRGV